MLLQPKYYKYLPVCSHNFKTFVAQQFFLKTTGYLLLIISWNAIFFKKIGVITCCMCVYESIYLPFVDETKFDSYADVSYEHRRYLMHFSLWVYYKMGNCLRCSRSSNIIAENVQFFNQFDPNETRYKYWNPKGNIYGVCDRGHGVLMLYIKSGGFTARHQRLWPSCRDGFCFD